MFKKLVQVVLFLTAATAGAQEASRPGPVSVGTVERVYAKVANNVYREVYLAAPSHDGMELWAEVRFGVDAGGDSRIALVPEGFNLQRGDMVQIRVAEPQGRRISMVAPVRDVNRVLAVSVRSEVASRIDFRIQTVLATSLKHTRWME